METLQYIGQVIGLFVLIMGLVGFVHMFFSWLRSSSASSAQQPSPSIISSMTPLVVQILETTMRPLPPAITRPAAGPQTKRVYGRRVKYDESTALQWRSSNDDEQPCCYICAQRYEQGDTLLCLRCTHHAHIDCLRTWFDRKSTCPVCRAKVIE